jgi:hypothetical protein
MTMLRLKMKDKCCPISQQSNHATHKVTTIVLCIAESLSGSFLYKGDNPTIASYNTSPALQEFTTQHEVYYVCSAYQNNNIFFHFVKITLANYNGSGLHNCTCT